MSDKTCSCWDRARAALRHIESSGGNLLLYGPPGTGKSYFAMHETKGSVEDLMVEVVNLTEEMGFYRIEGTDRLVEGTFKFTPGAASMSWQHGKRLILNEIEKTSGDVLSGLLGVLDGKAVAKWRLPDGTDVRPQNGFHCVATSNAAVPEELPEALADRFTFKVKVDEVSPHMLELLHPAIKPLAVATWNKQGSARRTMRQWLQLSQVLGQMKLSQDTIIHNELLIRGIFCEGASEVMQTLYSVIVRE